MWLVYPITENLSLTHSIHRNDHFTDPTIAHEWVVVVVAAAAEQVEIGLGCLKITTFASSTETLFSFYVESKKYGYINASQNQISC